MEEDEKDFSGSRNPFLLPPDVNKLLRENTELKTEIETLKRIIPLRSSLPEYGVEKIKANPEEKRLEEKYEEAKKLNEKYKKEVDFLTQQLNIVVTVAPPDGDENARWDEEKKILTIVRSSMNTPEQQEVLENLEKMIKKLKDEVAKTKKKENALRARLTGIDGFIEEKDLEIEELKCRNEDINSRNQALKDELVLIKKKRNNEKKEMETLKSSFGDMEEKMKKMEKNLKKKESRAAELKAELFSLAEKHKEVHRLNNKLKDEIKDLKLKREEKTCVTSENLKQKNNKIGELEKENNKLKKQIRGMRSDKIVEEKETIENMAKKVKDLQEMTSSMREKSPLLSPDVIKLTEAGNKLQEKLLKTENLKKNLKADLRNLIATFEDQQRQLAEETQEKMHLQVALRDARKKCLKLDKELISALDQVEQYDSEFASIVVLAEEKQELIDKLQDEKEKLQKYVGFLEGSLEKMKEEKVYDVRSKVDELITPPRGKSPSKNNGDTARTWKKPQAVSGSKPEKLKEKNKVTEGIIKRLEKERSNLNDKLRQLHQQLKDQKKFYETEIDLLKSVSDSTREKKDQLHNKKAELELVKTELEQAKAESEQAKAESEQAKAALEQAKAELEGSKIFPSPPDDVIMEEAKSLRSKIADLEKHVADQEKKKAELSTELLDGRKNLSSLQSQLDKAKKLAKKESEAKNDAKAALVALQPKLEKLLSSEKNLKSQLKKSQENAEEMEERLLLELNSIEKENDRLHRVNARLRGNMEKMKEEEKPTVSRIDVEPVGGEKPDEANRLLEVENKKLRGRMQELQNQLKFNQSNMKKLKENLENKTKSIEKMKNLAKSNDDKNKSLKIEMETLRDLNKNLVPKVAELKKLEQEQKEENKKLQHEVEHLGKELKLTTRLLEKLEKDRKETSAGPEPLQEERRKQHLKEKLNEAKNELNNSNDQIQFLKIREKNLKSALDDALENVAKLEENLEKERADKDDVTGSLQAKIEEKTQEIFERDEKIKKMIGANKVDKASDPLISSSLDSNPRIQPESPDEEVSHKLTNSNHPGDGDFPTASFPQPPPGENQTLEERIRILEKFHGSDIANLKSKKRELKNKLRCTEDEMTKLKIENENLKQEIKEFEKKEKSWESERRRTEDELDGLRDIARKHESAPDRNEEAQIMRKKLHQLEDELETTKIKLEVAKNNVDTLKNIRDLVVKNKEEKLIEAEEKLAECRRTLVQIQARKPANRDEVTSVEKEKLMEEMKNQREEIHKLEAVVRQLSGGVTPVAMKTYFSCRIANIALESENKKLMNEVQRLRGKNRGNSPDYVQKCPLCDELTKEILIVREEMTRLRAELAHFDDYFFSEVEDLRHNYAEAVKLNVVYEDQLREISARHSIRVNIRTEEVDAHGSNPRKVKESDPVNTCAKDAQKSIPMDSNANSNTKESAENVATP